MRPCKSQCVFTESSKENDQDKLQYVISPQAQQEAPILFSI